MKKNYERYGDILCFDITYKLLMRKKEEVRHTGIGFFIGMDEINAQKAKVKNLKTGEQSEVDFNHLTTYFISIFQ